MEKREQVPRGSSPSIGRVQLRKRRLIWSVRFTDNEGTRHDGLTLRVTNKVVAERKAAEINEALETGQPWEWVLDRTRPGERTFDDLMTEYLDRGSAWSESTRRGNVGTVRRLRDEFGATPLSALRRSMVESFLARLRAEDLSKASRNRYLACIKVVLAKGVEWEYLPDNPASGIRQESEGQKIPRPYRDDEVEALLDALDDVTREVATLYLETGLRRGELVKLLWGDVDLIGGTLIVRGPKNSRDRAIPLSSGALRVLTKRRKEWESLDISDLRVYGHRAVIHKAVRRAWHVLSPERRQVLRPVRSFRDTAITRLARSEQLPVVQELAGHATIEMTRRYAEVSPEAVRDAVTRVFG